MFGRFPNYSLRELYFTIFFLLACLCISSGTTAIVAVTPTGIVIGEDGKRFPEGTAVKISLLKKRFVVASLDTESAKRDDTGGIALFLSNLDREN